MNRDQELDDFNKGPTNGTLNDKRRMAFIYEELLNIRDILQGKDEDVGKCSYEENLPSN